MDQSQQLTELIEEAVGRGWTFFGQRDKAGFHFGVVLGDYDPFVYCTYDFNKRKSFGVERVLFGDNLSFLASLLPETFIAVAQLLVTDIDADRIPCLYSEVYGGQDE